MGTWNLLTGVLLIFSLKQFYHFSFVIDGGKVVKVGGACLLYVKFWRKGDLVG